MLTNIKAPLSAQLEITDKCNFRCIHCYRLNPYLEKNASLDLNNERFLSLAEKIVESKIFDVILTGGEPLFRKKIIESLLAYFKKNNIYVSLNTNLLLATEDFLENIKILKLDSLLISCPSINQHVYKYMTGNGNYKKFEENLKIVIEKNINFSITMVVNKLNINYIKETASYLKSLGIQKFSATPMGLNVKNPQFDLFLKQGEVIKIIKDLTYIKENLKMIVDIVEAVPKCLFPPKIYERNFNFLKRKCQAGRTVIAIANNGDIRPCSHNSDIYGNLLKEPMKTIWQKMTDWRTDKFIPEKCKNCGIVNKCLGGCRTTAKAFHNKWNSEDPWMTLPLEKDVFVKKTYIDNNFPVSSDAVIYFPENFKWRKEGDYYLVCVKNTRNATIINKELFQFILNLQKLLPANIDKIASIHQITSDNGYFQRVLKLLLKRGIIFIK